MFLTFEFYRGPSRLLDPRGEMTGQPIDLTIGWRGAIVFSPETLYLQQKKPDIGVQLLNPDGVPNPKS